MRNLLLISLLFLAHLSIAQKQGLRGQVFWVSGNQMPGPGKLKSPQQGAIREVHIYNAASLSDAVSKDGFFTEVKTMLVATVMSNPDGTFLVRLPEGKYSVFVKEPNGLFANLFDGSGCINCITIKKRKFSWLTIAVDYEAAY